MSLTNPEKKMSKSEPAGCLFLEDSPEQIQLKLSRAVTDTGPGKEMSAGVKNLFLLLWSFSDAKTVKKFNQAHTDGNIRYSDLKAQLASDISSHLAPFQKKFLALKREPKKLIAVLKDGAKRAQKVAGATLKEVKQKAGLLM